MSIRQIDDSSTLTDNLFYPSTNETFLRTIREKLFDLQEESLVMEVCSNTSVDFQGDVRGLAYNRKNTECYPRSLQAFWAASNRPSDMEKLTNESIRLNEDLLPFRVFLNREGS